MIKPIHFISALTLTSGITLLASNKASAQQCAGDLYGNSLSGIEFLFNAFFIRICK